MWNTKSASFSSGIIYWLNAVLCHISIKIKILLDSFKCPLLAPSALCIKHFVTSIIINNQFCIVLLPDSEEAHFWHFCRNWLPQSIKALARAANSIATHWLHIPPKFQYKTTPAFFQHLFIVSSFSDWKRREIEADSSQSSSLLHLWREEREKTRIERGKRGKEESRTENH